MKAAKLKKNYKNLGYKAETADPESKIYNYILIKSYLGRLVIWPLKPWCQCDIN
jgi:hypothetical protein